MMQSSRNLRLVLGLGPDNAAMPEPVTAGRERMATCAWTALQGG